MIYTRWELNITEGGSLYLPSGSFQCNQGAQRNTYIAVIHGIEGKLLRDFHRTSKGRGHRKRKEWDGREQSREEERERTEKEIGEKEVLTHRTRADLQRKSFNVSRKKEE